MVQGCNIQGSNDGNSPPPCSQKKIGVKRYKKKIQDLCIHYIDMKIDMIILLTYFIILYFVIIYLMHNVDTG